MDNGYKLFLAQEGWASALHALEVWPDVPDRVFEEISNEIQAEVQRVYPFAALPPDREGPRQGYQGVVRKLLARPGIDPAQCTGVAPSLPLLAAVCAVGYVLAVYTTTPPRRNVLPSGLDAGARLDLLTLVATNPRGESTEAQEILLEVIEEWLKGEMGVPEDRVQSALLHASWAIGGPPPKLIEAIVKTGQMPYEAQGLDAHIYVYPTGRRLLYDDGLGVVPLDTNLTVEGIRRLYAAMEKRYTHGLDVQGFADLLVKTSTGDDLIAGLRGQWVPICIFLVPYLCPPLISTMSLLPGSGSHRSWRAALHAFLKRIAQRDRKREQREAWRIAGSLDATIETDEGAVQLYEAVPGELDIPESTDLLLDGLGLTKRERQVCVLLAGGCIQEDVATVLRLSPGRVSQLISQIRKKLQKHRGISD